MSERVDAEVILRPDCTNPVGVIPRGPAVEKCITNKLVPGPDFPFDIPSLKKRFLPVTISMLRAIKNFIP